MCALSPVLRQACHIALCSKRYPPVWDFSTSASTISLGGLFANCRVPLLCRAIQCFKRESVVASTSTISRTVAEALRMWGMWEWQQANTGTMHIVTGFFHLAARLCSVKP